MAAFGIDPAAREHREIDFVFTDDKGKPRDLQHAVVDTSVPSRGRLVIWLMDHSPGLFDRVASYGLHGIQVVRRQGRTQLVGGADPRREGEALGD
jgi:hypothetical protein